MYNMYIMYNIYIMYIMLYIYIIYYIFVNMVPQWFPHGSSDPRRAHQSEAKGRLLRQHPTS